MSPREPNPSNGSGNPVHLRRLDAPSSPRAGPVRRFARAAARVWAREVVSGLVLPLLLVAALGLVQQAGLFAALDARFFDLVTTGERPATPQVVVVEHDAGFRSAVQVQGAEAHARLEAALTARGAEAIGYLAPRPTGLPQVSVPLVVGRVPQAVPANEAWALPGEGEERNAGATRAARSMALAQYGIHRSQLAALPGTHGPIAVFETALAASRDASLRPEGEFLVRMPRRQNIPQIGASQIIDGELARSELDGKIAIVADATALRPGIATPLTPDDRSMSEARFRAHALQTLLSRRAAYPAASWQAWWLLAIVALVLVLAYRRIDPKRLAVGLPTALSVLVGVGSWAALALGGKLLPVTALALAPWLVTFQRVLGRELRQDRRLEESASRAIEHSFRRSALREGARLPRFLGFAAQMAGVERSLLIERQAEGSIDEVVARNASIADIAAGRRGLPGFPARAAISTGSIPSPKATPRPSPPSWCARLPPRSANCCAGAPISTRVPTRTSASFRSTTRWPAPSRWWRANPARSAMVSTRSTPR